MAKLKIPEKFDITKWEFRSIETSISRWTSAKHFVEWQLGAWDKDLDEATDPEAKRQAKEHVDHFRHFLDALNKVLEKLKAERKRRLNAAKAPIVPK